MYDFKKYDGFSRSLLIFGPVGCGKTYTAKKILSEYRHRHKSEDTGQYTKTVYAITDTAFKFMVAQNTLKPRTPEQYASSIEKIPYEALTRCDLLLYDDIGSADVSDAYLSRLTLILDERHNRGLRTIFTTNLTSDQLMDRLGERILSRIFHECDGVKMTGDDLRKQSFRFYSE